MLRCDEPHVVQGGSENLSEALSRTAWCYPPPAVEYQYTRYVINLLSKNNLKNSGHQNVVDRVMCVWLCGPKNNVPFRFSKLFHKRWMALYRFSVLKRTDRRRNRIPIFSGTEPEAYEPNRQILEAHNRTNPNRTEPNRDRTVGMSKDERRFVTVNNGLMLYLGRNT